MPVLHDPNSTSRLPSETWVVLPHWLRSATDIHFNTSHLINCRLKCDRNQPCQNCIKRDLASSCTFIHAGLKEKSVSGIHKPNTAPNDIHGRIRLLEELVVSFMHKTAEKLPRDATSDSQLSKRTDTFTHDTLEDDLGRSSDSLGRISIDDEHPNYVGAAHWTAILDSVSVPDTPI
jgi:hypothetical protein